jgi:hypothetical protein
MESNATGATPIRLVDDPEAPGYRLIDHDTTYPYRQKELLQVVNAMLPNGVHINSYDLHCIRVMYSVDTNIKFCHTPKFATTQYSDACAQWLVQAHKENANVFAEARHWYFEKTHTK